MTAAVQTVRARRLRIDATAAERYLWTRLAGLASPAGHWRRQAPIGPYVVDFAHHAVSLVVEVDGDQHGREAGRAADARRDAWLRSQGYRVLRFWNAEVLRETEGVITTILDAMASAPPPKKRRRRPVSPPVPSSPSPSPSMGEGSPGTTSTSPSPSMGEGRGGGAEAGAGVGGTSNA